MTENWKMKGNVGWEKVSKFDIYVCITYLVQRDDGKSWVRKFGSVWGIWAV